MKRTLPDLHATLEQGSLVSTAAPAPEHARTRTRGFVIAWVFALLFYFLEYAVRSSPSVMIPQLSRTFHTTALGVTSILVFYYYTYSTVSLIAGATQFLGMLGGSVGQ